MKWQPFEYQGTTYDLSHLDPLYWSYTAAAGERRPERTYKFQVSFSMHCFSRDPLEGEVVVPGLWYEEEREKRVFCFDRHELSYQLPEIIRSMGDRVCWHTVHGSFFTIELTTKEGEEVEYEVYFDVTRATRKGWLNLIVKSAYVRTEDYASTQPKKRKIRLDVIAYKRQSKQDIQPGR
ncbi:MAG: hypothetical protein RPU52_15325 [Candidatus Sedimenticola sp. (ex Thyasira tokunagai)]